MKSVETRSIAYLCPDCNQSVIVTRDLFSLASNTSEIKCPCKKSKVTIDFLPETVEVKVPCHVCKKTHRVTCPSTVFVGEKPLTFSCGGIASCLIGSEADIFKATPRMEQEADLWAEQREQKGAFLNELVMEEVLEEVKEIASRGGISCVCGSDKWAFLAEYTLVELGCSRCGRVTRIPATVPEDIENICCCYEIKIGAGEEVNPIGEDI